MYLRRCYRREDARRHGYWAVVESYRSSREGGPAACGGIRGRDGRGGSPGYLPPSGPCCRGCSAAQDGEEALLPHGSAQRKQKELAMHERFEKRVEGGLEKVVASCTSESTSPELA
jgi:hypothetical protein